MKYYFILLNVVVWINALPISEPPAKLAFSLAQSEDYVEKSETLKPTGFAGVLRRISENSYVRDFLNLFQMVSDFHPNPQARAAPLHQEVKPIPLNDQQQKHFETSFSMDDPVVNMPDPKKSIKNEEWAKTLFGEKGALTGIFQMMDQQKKAQAHQAMHDPTNKINGKPFDFDFNKIFDSLLSGSSKGQFGDPGPELPEFLGICNRLSCADIYKAIDKFRRSEFFSNFQTALQLVQDPNGWETIGKLLSNPELISQFTAGSGMEELFGSALGTAKNESTMAKDRNSRLLPEDGNFGTDFTDLEEGKAANKPKETELPEIDFSIDGKPESGDYYEEVDKNGADYEEEVEKEELQITTSTTTTKKPSTEEGMPELSFSVDGEPDEGETFETIVDVVPPSSTIIKGVQTTAIKTNEIILSKSVGTFHKNRIEQTTRMFSTKHIPTTSYVMTTKMLTTTPVPTTKFKYSTSTSPRPTTRNYRKDSDYYAMYYDDQPK